jgi:hypothetical protein
MLGYLAKFGQVAELQGMGSRQILLTRNTEILRQQPFSNQSFLPANTSRSTYLFSPIDLHQSIMQTLHTNIDPSIFPARPPHQSLSSSISFTDLMRISPSKPFSQFSNLQSPNPILS